ncbi:hypothetical protein [Microbacterium sp. UFMG61]|uniref:hypothetical protein n=1 Tax=Microbacterium sp. UFMG61 TaxID=2745935 RepID=UPI00188F535D|nr:hypothetical protein [Microbacterium sp. UFMG61]
MAQAPDTAPTTDPTPRGDAPRRTKSGVWLGAVALVLSALLIALVFPVAGVLPVALVAALLAVIAVVVGIRASGTRGARASVVTAMLALVADVIVIVIMAVGVFGGSGLNQVEVRATGGPAFRVSFADDTRSYDEEWDSSGWKQYTTTGDSAEIAVTAPADAADQEVTCQILWNGEVVVEQIGDGSVTCRYDAG